MFLKHTKTVDGNFMQVLTRDPERYRPIVQFLNSVTHGLAELSWRECELIGAKISEADIEAVRRAGWSDQTVEDVVGLVGIMRLYDILTSGLGFGRTLPDEAFGEMGRMTVDQQGYTTTFDSFVAPAADL